MKWIVGWLVVSSAIGAYVHATKQSQRAVKAEVALLRCESEPPPFCPPPPPPVVCSDLGTRSRP